MEAERQEVEGSIVIVSKNRRARPWDLGGEREELELVRFGLCVDSGTLRGRLENDNE